MERPRVGRTTHSSSGDPSIYPDSFEATDLEGLLAERRAEIDFSAV